MNSQKISYDDNVLLDINNITIEPGPYTMSFGFDPIPLTESIKKIGLINPPIVIKDSRKGFDIVSGYRRLTVLKKLDEKQVYCIDLSSLGLSPENLFFLNLHENITVRSFNLIEKGMIIRRLSSYITRDEIIKHYLTPLQIHNINDLDILLKIEQLSVHSKLYIAKDLLSLKTIRLIIDMEERSRDALIKLIINLRLNFNYQYQLTEYLKDISDTENIPIYEILKEGQYQNIIEDERANNPQKVKHLFGLIRERKFPLLSKYEKTFNKRVSRLNLPQKIKIENPRFFEAPDFRLDISFKNGEELLEKIRYLSKLESLSSIVPPWQNNDK